MASTESESTGTRPVRACTECKQSKLKCDSKATFPNPCSRCRSRQLVCMVDSSFRRTPARKRVETMRRELEQLRSQQNIDYSMPTSESSLEPDGERRSTQMAAPASSHDFDLKCSGAVSLDGTMLSPALAVDALKLFADLFLAQFPIIGAISATDLYSRRPLLFWTILLIVFSRHREMIDDDVFEALLESFTRQLRNEITDAPLPLFKIHVLLLLTMWALPVIAQIRDPGLLYCGIAIQAARYMGLDRNQTVPSLCSIGVPAGHIDTRINTWIGCFYATTLLSLQLGLRPMIDADIDLTAVQNFLARNTLSQEFQTLVRIQVVVAKYSSLLSHDMLNQSGYVSIMRLIESELDVLQSAGQETGTMTQIINLSILDVKLHFYAFLMTKLSSQAPSQQVTFKNGLTSAVRIIQLANLPESSGADDDDGSGQLRRRRSRHKHHFRSLSFATVILLKFFYLNSTAPKEEHEAALTHIGIAHNIFRSCSARANDEYVRAAHFFECLSHLRQGTSNYQTSLRLDHLMGVSILFDALSTAAEMRGRPVELSEAEAGDGEADFAAYDDPGGEQMFDNRPYPPTYQVDPTMAFLTEFWEGQVTDLMVGDIML